MKQIDRGGYIGQVEVYIDDSKIEYIDGINSKWIYDADEMIMRKEKGRDLLNSKGHCGLSSSQTSCVSLPWCHHRRQRMMARPVNSVNIDPDAH